MIHQKQNLWFSSLLECNLLSSKDKNHSILLIQALYLQYSQSCSDQCCWGKNCTNSNVKHAWGKLVWLFLSHSMLYPSFLTIGYKFMPCSYNPCLRRSCYVSSSSCRHCIIFSFKITKYFWKLYVHIFNLLSNACLSFIVVNGLYL